MEKKLALELVDFLYDSPSACHGVKATQKILNENGFIELYVFEQCTDFAKTLFSDCEYVKKIYNSKFIQKV